MYDILSIFESNYLFFASWALFGGTVGLLLKKLSRCLTRQIKLAIHAESVPFRQTSQPDSLSYPSVKLLPWVEAVLPIAMLFLAWLCGALDSWQVALVNLFFIANCLLLASVDAKTGILPNALNSLLILSGLTWQVLIKGGLSITAILTQADYVWAMGLGYSVPMLMAWGYAYFTKVHPMGQGDAKMLAGLGAWLGLNGLVMATLMASVSASLWVLGGMLMGRYKRQQAVPFGPFLALGAISVFVWGIWHQHA
ncbi:MAG: A24 family peptidase [Burkholderiaceae bacterium]|nr:A24 family peptidase [Burkholderiaceae bacterium]